MKLLILLFSFILFFSSCADRPNIVFKEFYAEDINEFIGKMQNYNSVEGILNITYEDRNSIFNGQAFLKIKESEFLLRIYYLGIPSAEIYEDKGEIISTVFIERETLKQIVMGIRKGFFWWKGNFLVNENSEVFILKENGRLIFVNKENFTPVKQILTIDDKEILIVYERNEDVKTDDGIIFKMPLNLKVSYKNRFLKIEIERIKILHG